MPTRLRGSIDMTTRDASRPTSPTSRRRSARARTRRTIPSSINYGNAVSNTYTLNFCYGLGMVAEGTGVILNNELDDFTAAVGASNAYGLVGFEANLPGPGKRPLSSMSPTIVLKDGKPVLVTGTPGGSRIITGVLQVILNTIDHGMNAAAAVAAPRLHNQWLPDEVRVENGFPAEVLDTLARARPQRADAAAADLRKLDRDHAGGPCRRARSAHARRIRGRALAIVIARSKATTATGSRPR